MRMRRSVSSIALIAALGIVFMAIGTMRRGLVARAQSKPESTAVKIDNFSFGPATLTVSVGTTVTWTNREFSFTFPKAGTYPYFCSIHPKMTGKVVVQ
jgi:plastocyanin